MRDHLPDIMGRVRGQGRLIIILAVTFVVVYIIYHVSFKSMLHSKGKSARFSENNGKLPSMVGAPDGYGDNGRERKQADTLSGGNSQIEIDNHRHFPHHQLDDNSQHVDSAADIDPGDDVDEEAKEPPILDPFKSIPKPKTEQSLYHDIDESWMTDFKEMHRLVHLDLKGAAPKLSYLEYLIPLFAKMGATGLLLEYEDMFPYSGDLADIAAGNAYSVGDIIRIKELAKDHHLIIIPLIQTLGHMEFVLKLDKYKNLREHPDIPQVICASNAATIVVIKKMIEQVIGLHKESRYVHIGADEPYQFSEGRSKEWIVKQHTTPGGLFLQHIVPVANYVKEFGKKAIMWDDMLRYMPVSDLKNSNIGNVVEPMIWQYSPDPAKYLPENIWTTYKAVFGNVWAATAFKGATGSGQYITDVSIHLRNHLSWISIMKHYGNHTVHFRGTVLTGWQRYDHFSTLCELIPVALHSLGVCLQTLKYGGFDKAKHITVSKEFLSCSDLFPLELKQDIIDPFKNSYILPHCKFMGVEIFESVHRLFLNHMRYNHHSVNNRIASWVNDYTVKYNFASPAQAKRLWQQLNIISDDLTSLKKDMSLYLSKLYDTYTAEEWIEVNIAQFMRQIDLNRNKAIKLLSTKTWPRRPLIPQPKVGNNQDISGTGSKLHYQPRDSNVIQTGNENIEQNAPPVSNVKVWTNDGAEMHRKQAELPDSAGRQPQAELPDHLADQPQAELLDPAGGHPQAELPNAAGGQPRNAKQDRLRSQVGQQRNDQLVHKFSNAMREDPARDNDIVGKENEPDHDKSVVQKKRAKYVQQLPINHDAAEHEHEHQDDVVEK